MTRPRVLILDDALAAVDTQTEEEILARLEGATAGMTVIVVSHRISSIKGVDRIYLLEGGRIVEEGTHQELLERSGAYTEIYRQQLLADELEGL
jgi:ATP-binding cassette subfamily B protein